MSALILRLIACLAMLLDHIGFIYGISLFRIVGRIAFPIFVFLLYNGYKHTSSKGKYAFRLALFALLSQIPFSLFCNYPTCWYKGNVMFSLLLAFLSLWSLDMMFKTKPLKYLCFLPAFFICLILHKGYFQTDYGAKAVLMIIAFWMLDGEKAWKRILSCILLLCIVFYSQLFGWLLDLLRGNVGSFSMTSWERTQAWSVFAMPLIFLYNGQKGKLPGGPRLNRLVQYGFYAFYPVHMMLLWLIAG